MESPIVQKYLEVICKLQLEGRKFGTTELGRGLNVSPASASDMTDRLAEKGLVGKAKETGITLTEKGRKAALAIIRTHRISERFLLEVLGMDWKDVHEEACKLEHVISPAVEARMEALLTNTATCPHGNPIPDKHGRTAQARQRTLNTLKRSESGVIARISDERRDLLEYLTTLGLMPGSAVVVEQVAPFGGPLLVRTKGARYALAREIAEKIWVNK
jgi:DtxR family Mn-dependent transcriptional regulator